MMKNVHIPRDLLPLELVAWGIPRNGGRKGGGMIGMGRVFGAVTVISTGKPTPTRRSVFG